MTNLIRRTRLALYWLRAYIPGTRECQLRRLLWRGRTEATSTMAAALYTSGRISALDVSAYRTFRERT